MNDLLTRVATAICKSRTCEGASCCQWPANRGRRQCPVRDGGYDDAARAAVAAIREPTETMRNAGIAFIRGGSDPAACTLSATTVWKVMIDSALD